jgi:hypothetical protein
MFVKKFETLVKRVNKEIFANELSAEGNQLARMFRQALCVRVNRTC